MRRAMLLSLLALALPTAALASSFTVHFDIGETFGGGISPFPDITNFFSASLAGSDGSDSIDGSIITGSGSLSLFALPANPSGSQFVSFTDSLSGVSAFASPQVDGEPGFAEASGTLLPSSQIVDVCTLGNQGQQICHEATIAGGRISIFGGVRDGSFINTAGVIADVTFTPIPEPGTLGMLGTGLIGLAGFARRKLKVRG